MQPPSWESEAANWIAWARRPGHDAYWYYRDEFFSAVVPRVGRRTLEVGCGEGRVTRDLSARGHRVIGVDSSPTLLAAAGAADPKGTYLLADAAALPLAPASVDLVVAYNSLMDVADLAGTVAEMARVLTPRGRVCASITHPCTDTGRFERTGEAATLTLQSPYFGTRPFEASVERDGLAMTFRGWERPLQDYVGAMAGAGLLVDQLREPAPAGATPEHLERGRWFPMFLHLRAVKS